MGSIPIEATFLVMKNELKKGTRKPSVKALIKKLDAVFSRYIRLRDAMPNSGTCFCISCGRPHNWMTIQNGHYMSRRYMSTRFSEMNCNAQCVACNIYNQGNIQMYRRALVKKYGEEAVDRLEVTARVESKKYSSWELDELIKYYKTLSDALMKDKHLK